MGSDLNGSWSTNHYEAASATNDGTNYYVGTSGGAGDAEVWKWNGSSWLKIGGDGVASSWPDQTYESVTSLAYNNNTLYAGLGSSTGDGETVSRFAPTTHPKDMETDIKRLLAATK